MAEDKVIVYDLRTLDTLVLEISSVQEVGVDSVIVRDVIQDIEGEFVPYTGATKDVVLGSKYLQARHILSTTLDDSPFTVYSSIKVNNLNADLLDGKHAEDFAEISHIHYKSDIVDFDHQHNFINLGDTPSSYEGQAGKVLVVKSDETGLEFTSLPTYQIPSKLLDLEDTPSSYEGQAGKVLVVNDEENGLIFSDKGVSLNEIYYGNILENKFSDIGFNFDENYVFKVLRLAILDSESNVGVLLRHGFVGIAFSPELGSSFVSLGGTNFMLGGFEGLDIGTYNYDGTDYFCLSFSSPTGGTIFLLGYFNRSDTPIIGNFMPTSNLELKYPTANYSKIGKLDIEEEEQLPSPSENLEGKMYLVYDSQWNPSVKICVWDPQAQDFVWKTITLT